MWTCRGMELRSSGGAVQAGRRRGVERYGALEACCGPKNVQRYGDLSLEGAAASLWTWRHRGTAAYCRRRCYHGRIHNRRNQLQATLRHGNRPSLLTEGTRATNRLWILFLSEFTCSKCTGHRGRSFNSQQPCIASTADYKLAEAHHCY